MRFKDLIEVSGNLEKNDEINHLDAIVISVLSVIQDRIRDGGIKPYVKLNTVLKLLSNATKLTYTKEDLIAIKDRNKTIDNMIKNIDDQNVEFLTSENKVDASINDSETIDMDATDIPQNIVSNMAKTAMKRRKD